MAGTNFFRDFRKVNYHFGDNELPVAFQDISIYVDIFDQVAQYSSFYQNYQIQNGERPDHVSYKLYNTPEYHWTFFFLNEKLRRSSWPMDNFRLYEQAKQYYPNVTVMTMGSVYRRGLNRYDSMSTHSIFKPGGTVWFQKSDALGRIIKIDHNLGQVTVELLEPRVKDFPSESRNDTLYAVPANLVSKIDRYLTLLTEEFRAGDDEEFLELADEMPIIQQELDFTEISGPRTVSSTIETTRTALPVTYEYDAIHHFEDADGEYVFPPYYRPNNLYEGSFALNWNEMTTLQSMTYLERLQILNEEQRAIQVIKPDSIDKVVSEFRQLIKN